MAYTNDYMITKEEKEHYIDALSTELSMLRVKANMSQEEVACAIGVSRQTYSSIERMNRRMSWSIFISLVFLYDCNNKTRSLIRTISFPYDFVRKLNDQTEMEEDYELGDFLNNEERFIIDKLDEQALRSIRTVIMVEYARCTNS